MDFIRRHWLGFAVLVSITCFALNMRPKVDATMEFWAVAFVFFSCAWMLRGIFRFFGRAWNHSVTEQQRKAR